MKTIPFSSPDIQNSDLKAVESVIRSGWLAHGEYSKKLEQLFCEYTGAKYATTVSNCTAGLHLSCLAAGFSPGDEVIVPAQTHTATAHAVEFTGAKAVFADVDPLSGNIFLEELDRKLTDQTKGIIPVHMAGYPCDMEKIKFFNFINNSFIIRNHHTPLPRSDLFGRVEGKTAGYAMITCMHAIKGSPNGMGTVLNQ